MSDTTDLPVCALCGQPAVLVWLRFNDSTNTTVGNVFACAEHEVSPDLAALTHLSTCTAPNAADLPNCDCQPISVTQPLVRHAA